MLKLRKGRPAAIAVPLGGGAVAMVRPATAFEYDLAAAGARKLLAGLIESRDSAALVVDILGEEFVGANFTDSAWLQAAALRVTLLESALLCVASWDGVVDESDQPIEKPSREMLALLLRDGVVAKSIRDAIESRVNLETAEGNGLPGSLTGAPGTLDGARNAAPPTTLAPMDDQSSARTVN